MNESIGINRLARCLNVQPNAKAKRACLVRQTLFYVRRILVDGTGIEPVTPAV